MKLYKLSILALALAGAFASCSDDDNYVPGPQSAGAYFPTSNQSSIAITGEDSQVSVNIMRSEASSEATYNLISTLSEDAEGIFNVPQTVSFASGQKEATIVIPFDKSLIAYNVNYNIKLSLADDQSNEYGKAVYSFNVIKKETWKDLGYALYTEDMITTFFNVENITYKVAVQECEQQAGKYRLVNPYGAPYPYNEPGDYDNTENHYMVIDASDPNAVYIELFRSGMNWGYGEFIFYSMAGYYLNRGVSKEDIAAQGLFGQLDEGSITFPVESLLIAMTDYNDGGLYPSNVNGLFRLTLPGYYSDKTYTSSIKYDGLFTSAEDEMSYALATINVGADVTIAHAAIMATDDANAVIDAIMNETVQTQQFNAGKNQSARFVVPGPGQYTIGLLCYDGEEAVAADAATFTVAGSVPEQGNWAPVGQGAFVDGWILPGFSSDGGVTSINPFDWTYYVEIEKDMDHEGIYRVVNPYLGDVPLGGLNTNKKATSIVFDCTDPNFVIVEMQYSGFTMDEFFTEGVKNEQIWISDGDWYFINEGYDKEDVINAGINSVFEDGIIYIPSPFFGQQPGKGEFGYSWGDPQEGIEPYPVIVYFPEALAEAPARKAVSKKSMKRGHNLYKMNNGMRLIIKKNHGQLVGYIND